MWLPPALIAPVYRVLAGDNVQCTCSMGSPPVPSAVVWHMRLAPDGIMVIALVDSFASTSVIKNILVGDMQ